MPARTDRRDAQAIAPARRPDVPGAYAAAQASAAKIKAAESEFMPKVFVSASTPYNAGRAAINAIPPVGQQAPTVNLNGSRYGGGVFVGVTIPRYDGGLRSAVLMQARNDAGSASARLERTKDEGRSGQADRRRAERAARESRVARCGGDARRRRADHCDAALDAYRHGVGSITDAMLARNDLLAAQTAYADSYGAALSAAASLALATGTVAQTPEAQ
ncbi:outer membrane efflux protein [Burkholderia pseudomallei]|nr:outer membrane efflux family protein [Burkholderia pseudomallei NCTC 13178]CAJ2892107.1 outer membrane efflux protein [Burkholderia pseudomallei]CAJ5324409.1 outer membrane efflux protein [Burkholderia pseudomallei]VBE85854.1 outer membrane efflux protein [Burkholderia pseudomallei]VBV67123.1 outer membrane efflux protein [Burkholderia pseudomallei]